MLGCCKDVNFQYAKRPYWLSVAEAIVLHIGDREWDCKGSLDWLVQIVLQLRMWLELGRQSRDNKGEICLRLTMTLIKLDCMY